VERKMKKGDWIFWRVAGDEKNKIWARIDQYQPSRGIFFSYMTFESHKDYGDFHVMFERRSWPILSDIQVVINRRHKIDLIKSLFEATRQFGVSR
jgi:hypothetical protein